MQFMKNCSGEYVCTDLNLRTAGGMTLSYAAGWDEVSALANIMLGKDESSILQTVNKKICEQYVVRHYEEVVTKFEVYFDGKGEVRKELKSRLLQKLFTLNKCYPEEFRKIGEYLKSKTENFVYYLENDSQISYNFELTISKKKSTEDETEYNEIESIKINGHEILFDKFDEKYGARYLSLTRDYYVFDSLKEIFSTTLCIPFDLVKLDNHSLETKNLTIKKWIKINSKENCCYKLLEE